MRVLIISNSFIIKDSIKSAFSRQYENSEVKELSELKNLEIGELNIFDIIFIHTLPKSSGIETYLENIKNDNNKIVVLDPSKDVKVLSKCIKNNIDAYITDFEDEDEFKYIMKKIVKGSKFYDSKVTQLMLKNKESSLQTNLTSREKEVMDEVGKGLSNRDISNSLNITEYTVKKHISSILSKLNFKNRADIILYVNNK